MSLFFDLPWVALLSVPLAVLTAAVFWLWHRRRVGRLALLGGDAAIARLAPANVRQPPIARAVRVSIAVGLMTIGFSGPRWGTGTGIVKTDGIDVSLNYHRDIGFAKLALSFLGNYTFHSNFRSNAADPNSVDRDCTGYFSANCPSIQPKFQWSQRTTLSFDKVDLSLLWRHIDQANYEATASNYVARGLNGGTDAAPVPALLFSGKLPDGTGPYNFNHIRPYDYFDVSARFALTPTLELTLGVSNVFNVKPPIVGSTAGTTSFNSGNTYPSTYDALGRAYAASVKVRF